MNYQEAVAYIESIPKFTSKTDLAHTARLLEVLGTPQKKLPHVIHVAGTNGKGSVCAYLNSCLMQGGYRCGLFTSPHLVRINERIQIDRRPVSDEAFLSGFLRVMDAVQQTTAAGDTHPTYFETLFLIGICVFAEEKTDYCILETGMGGRLDQTNVIEAPDASVITSISRDHMEYLGDTIEQIAYEKAGIIKPGIPVIYDANNTSAAEVIRARADALQSPSYSITTGALRCLLQDADGITFRYFMDREAMPEPARPAKPDAAVQRTEAVSGVLEENEEGELLHISSIADYQMMNAALARKTLEVLKPVHGMPDEVIRAGIAAAGWPCRMEQKAPGVIIDGAHNEDGVAAFIRTAVHFHETNDITILFASVSDKDYPEMIRRIAEQVRPEHVVTTSVGGSRSLSAEVFADQFRSCGCEDVSAENAVEGAYALALEKKGADGMLFCVGSLYMAGELMRL